MAPKGSRQTFITSFLTSDTVSNSPHAPGVDMRQGKNWAYMEYSWPKGKPQHHSSHRSVIACSPAQPAPQALSQGPGEAASPPCGQGRTQGLPLSNRSLTDMLLESADELNNSQSLASHVELEAKLTAAYIQIEDLTAENSSLVSQIDLINDELKCQKKTLHFQKSSIKKLTKDDDNLRKELSQFRGMRKYTQGAVDTTAIQRPDCTDGIEEELGIANAKLNSLRDQMVNITSSMLALLEDENKSDDSFQIVKHRKCKRTSCNDKTNPHYLNKTHVTTPRHQGQSSQTSQGRPIPVVTGVGKPEASLVTYKPPSYNDVTAARHPRTNADTYVIGTSLTRGLGARLKQHGVDGTVICYPGATIPNIRSRLRYILPKDNQPREIILQCGGNDLESQSVGKVSFQYDCLIEDVRKLCPKSAIMISKIPPRGHSTTTLRKIDALNENLSSKSDIGNQVTLANACPYFSRDQVHFNKRGFDVYAAKLAQSVINFSWHRMREMV